MELMNSNRPLAEISKSVPHCYKGEKLIEMIFVKKIPLNRAVWYIRINGATEIVRSSALYHRNTTDHPYSKIRELDLDSLSLAILMNGQ